MTTFSTAEAYRAKAGVNLAPLVTQRQGRVGFVAGVLEDLDAAIERDPAATGRLQMALVSPGLHAIWSHRVTHQLWQRPSLRLPARLLSNVARAVTGVEIHPGGPVRRRLLIPHGVGGAKGKRHPTLGNGVTIGSGARVLGAITLGDGAQVGANAVVVKDVPANAVAVGIPAQVRIPGPDQSPTDAMYDDPAVWI